MAHALQIVLLSLLLVHLDSSLWSFIFPLGASVPALWAEPFHVIADLFHGFSTHKVYSPDEGGVRFEVVPAQERGGLEGCGEGLPPQILICHIFVLRPLGA